MAGSNGKIVKTGHSIAGVPVYRWDFKSTIDGSDQHVGYCRINDIPDDDKEKFLQWMAGQTIPLIEPEESNYNVYPHDWQRFVERVKKGLPTYFD